MLIGQPNLKKLIMKVSIILIGITLAFRLVVMLKEARIEANLTHEELAEKTGTKKSYFSRIERGLSDIQISTYYKLIELGLGKHLNISIG
jgi:transcriptional regulator with XRE-family HTH domain